MKEEEEKGEREGEKRGRRRRCKKGTGVDRSPQNNLLQRRGMFHSSFLCSPFLEAYGWFQPPRSGAANIVSKGTDGKSFQLWVACSLCQNSALMNTAVGKASVSGYGSVPIIVYLYSRWHIGSGLQTRVCQPQLLISGSVLIPTFSESVLQLQLLLT